MPHLVIGTAGHIDHGKTSLVKALTGMDADRLLEEKQRGITIDIGFAHTEPSPGLTLSFVDLPGHERFIKNMLAGVTGIDALLFVVASDKSVMPQTREHFEICRLLGIRRGVIALTKSDRVDDSMIEVVRLEVAELVSGSFLENAPMVPVSSTTGDGIGSLLRQLVEIATQATSRDVDGYFRLPVDRAFTVKGFGTVVTGTLLSGSVAVESEVELYPTFHRVRVRGLQVHGEPVQRAVAGQRTALNLAGIDATLIHRGMVLSEPDRFRPAKRLDCTLEMVRGVKPFKRPVMVHFHSGAAEIQARLTVLSEGRARIYLRERMLVLPGDHFIVRAGTPLAAAAGGEVLAIDSSRVKTPVRTLAEAIAATGLPLAALKRSTEAVQFIEPDILADRDWLEAQAREVEEAVVKYHKAEPLRRGPSREAFKLPKPIVDYILATTKVLVTEGDTVRHVKYAVTLEDKDLEARAMIEKIYADAHLEAPSINQALTACVGVSVQRGKGIVQLLLNEKKLVRIGPDLLFHASALEALRATVATHKGKTFNVGDFKEWTGISRKYAIPLLEYLDRVHVTRRVGNDRLVL